MLVGLSSLSRCQAGAGLLRCKACRAVSNAGSRFGMHNPMSTATYVQQPPSTLRSRLHFGEVSYSFGMCTRRSVQPARWRAAPHCQPAGNRQAAGKPCRPRSISHQLRCVSTTATECAPTQQTRNGSSPPFRRRTTVKDIKGGEDQGVKSIGKTFDIRGWVRTARNQKAFSFLEVNDGTTLAGLQVVVLSAATGYNLLQLGTINTGAAVRVQGELVESPGKGQKVELQAKSVELIGECSAETYPLQKKKHTLEYLRSIAHLRPRTNTLGAVTRVRSALAFATHQFFRESGFQYIHTPILSGSDCEGAGEMFQVTTLMSRHDLALTQPAVTEEELDHLEKQIVDQGNAVKEAKAASKEANTPEAKAQEKEAVQQLLQLKQQLWSSQQMHHHAKGLPKTPQGQVDYQQDFFGKPTFLTVSGQLNAEIYATALSDVYTFGPTFRAENSNTSRHLAEFWMIEPEMAFADLADDMNCAEAYLKHCLQYVLTQCSEDMHFFAQQNDDTLVQRLQDIVSKPFARISYTDAVGLLQKAKAKFEFPVHWGADLQSEHERYLTEKEFEGTPLFVTDYPKDIKAFYMRLNSDEKTVAAMDLLVPRVGELIGGSQREERLQELEKRLAAQDLDPADYWWYLDLRRYGSVPHAGFGLGFERLVQFTTGMENIRDVIPFPRYPGHCEF